MSLPTPPPTLPTTANARTLTKSEALDRLKLLLDEGLFTEAEKFRTTHRHILKPDVPYGAQHWLDQFITQDKEMLRVKSDIGKLSVVNDNVLIQGPTGTGKEILSRALHADRSEVSTSKPNEGKFISVNCAGLPDGLIESELFGHVKGAFTGACDTTKGLFAEAENGTLLLDEVGELPLPVQAKLLRVLQERTIRKVGGKSYEPVNCRVVCATHQPLDKLVTMFRFREDLFARISVFTIYLTPLTDRMDDVPLITEYVAKRYEVEHKVHESKKFPVEMYRLKASELKFNVRSIQSVVRRYHVLGERITD